MDKENLYKNYIFQLLIILIIVYIIHISFFFSIWAVGLSKSHESFIVTLSYMIVTNNEVRLMYIIWIFIYAIFTFISIYTIFKADISIVNNTCIKPIHYTIHCSARVKQSFFIISTLLYIPFCALKVYSFFLLWNYNYNTAPSQHYIWTAIAIISCIICSVLLFIRRLCCRIYIYIHNWIYILLFTNFLLIISQIVFVVLLSISNQEKGLYEILLSITIGLEPIFQISDVYSDYICTPSQEKYYRIQSTGARISHILKQKSNTEYIKGVNITLKESLIIQNKKYNV